MRYIKIWSEYDISGEFGGNNNEECLIVEDGTDVDKAVKAYVMEATHVSEENYEEELEGLYDWEYITLITLEKGE